MVKSKQRKLGVKHSNKKHTRGGRVGSSKPNVELDLLGEDGWVVVKKQRVTILIPPLPSSKKSRMANQGPGQVGAKPSKEVEDQSRISVRISPSLPPEPEREKSTLLAHKKGIEIAKISPALQIPTSVKSPTLGLRAEPKKPGVVTLKSRKIHRVHEAPKTMRSLRSVHCPNIAFSGSMLLNRRLRVSNLERKLQQAGGLTRWLTSLGLGQFVRIFRAKSINRFQLVNLNMQKLKDMGADAVGPRRKLIHAIDCVCQPFCFDPLEMVISGNRAMFGMMLALEASMKERRTFPKVLGMEHTTYVLFGVFGYMAYW